MGQLARTLTNPTGHEVNNHKSLKWLTMSLNRSDSPRLDEKDYWFRHWSSDNLWDSDVRFVIILAIT